MQIRTSQTCPCPPALFIFSRAYATCSSDWIHRELEGHWDGKFPFFFFCLKATHMLGFPPPIFTTFYIIFSIQSRFSLFCLLKTTGSLSFTFSRETSGVYGTSETEKRLGGEGEEREREIF
jgi:hypothetical protein